MLMLKEMEMCAKLIRRRRHLLLTYAANMKMHQKLKGLLQMRRLDFFDFTQSFVYLGQTLTFLLSDAVDAKIEC